MSQFSKFLRRFAPEMRGLGGALQLLAQGVGLPPAEKERVLKGAQLFLDGADNIMASIETLKDASAPTAEQVRNAVKAVLPDIIGGLSEAALRELLEAKTKEKK